MARAAPARGRELRKAASQLDLPWARSWLAGVVRENFMRLVLDPTMDYYAARRATGREKLQSVTAPVILVANHASHMDTPLILCALPKAWRERTAVAAAADYFFDVWWRQAFTALVYAGFPIDRSRGGKGIDKARELVRDRWSIVVFPEGTRTPDGHMQRFRHGASRLALELGVGLVPIAIVGAYQAMPKGRWWPGKGRPVVTIRYGDPIYPQEGETHQSLSLRMQQAVAQLFDEDRTTWFDAISRAERSETPSLAGPVAPAWRRTWEGSRPVARRGRPKAWE